MEWFFLGYTLKTKAFMIASTLRSEGAEQESGSMAVSFVHSAQK
jgi:hypothetical protein